MAYEQGRDAKKVVFQSRSEKRTIGPNELGAWSAYQDKIFVNKDVITHGCCDKTKPGSRVDAKLKVLDTVICEGRHAFQDYSNEHHDKFE